MKPLNFCCALPPIQPHHPAPPPAVLLLGAQVWYPLAPLLGLQFPSPRAPLCRGPIVRAGVAIFNQELSAGGGASRTETYYRKALVAKMYFGADGQTVTATSEEYSRSTVKEAAARTGAGAARAKAAAAAAAAGEGGAGAGAAEDDVDALDIHVGAADAMDDHDLEGSDLDTSEPAAAESGAQAQGQAQQDPGQVVTTVVTATIASGGAAQQQAQQQQQEQKAAEAKAAAEAAAAAAAAAQQQPQQQPQAAAQPAQAAGQPQQQQVDPADVSAWWSDVVSPDGQRVPKPAKRERDISASLASAGGCAQAGRRRIWAPHVAPHVASRARLACLDKLQPAATAQLAHCMAIVHPGLPRRCAATPAGPPPAPLLRDPPLPTNLANLVARCTCPPFLLVTLLCSHL